MKIVNYALPMYLGGVVEYRDKIGKILDLEERNGYCFLWALVGEEFQERRIVVYCVPKGEMWREDVGRMEFAGMARGERDEEWFYFVDWE